MADVVSTAMDKQILNQTTELLRTIADQTDGRAIVNRNDPLPALQQMIKDNTTYYLMSFTSTSAYRDGKFHEFQVRVKRPGVEVRARRGYWAVSAEEMAKASGAEGTAGDRGHHCAECAGNGRRVRTTAADPCVGGSGEG